MGYGENIMGKYGIFDIVGPIMIGPSSSHTAGAVRIGLMTGQLTEYDPFEVKLQFHGSLAKDYRAHYTDAGVLAGIMGIQVDDERIRTAFEIAEEKGIAVKCEPVNIAGAHPSTIVVIQKSRNGTLSTVRSKTIGGGNIVVEEINGYPVEITGDHHEIFFIGSNSDKVSTVIGSKWKWIIGKDKIYTQYRTDAASSEEVKKTIHSLSRLGFVAYFKPIVDEKGFGLEFFDRIGDLIQEATRSRKSVGRIVIEYEVKNTEKDEHWVKLKMQRCRDVMRKAGYLGISQAQKTLGGLGGGDAPRLERSRTVGRTLSGSTLVRAAALALGSAEVNAAMGRVVACPTAGSCGVLSAVVAATAENRGLPDSKVVEALFAAAGAGLIIAENFTISGSTGGCQAECGVASAMAAAALVELEGGTPEQLGHAIAISLKNIIGLVCDPVAGFVEVPCIKRNAGAVANAFISADMALSGIRSIIPPDEVVAALKDVGQLMDPKLKATLGGGLATTTTAKKIEKNLKF
jgi:L-serine dehydratase